MRRFELVEGTSNKFWEIAQDGSAVSVRFGRIGSEGQSKVKSLGSASAAASEIAKLVAEKTKKGYVEMAIGGSAAAAAAAKAPKPAKVDKPALPVEGWVAAGGGYELSIVGGKLTARKNGSALASVPKALKEGELGERLLAAIEFLESHAESCRAQVEAWMLRSLPVPRRVLLAVHADEAWRAALENAVVLPLDKSGNADHEAAGFFRGVDAKKGLGVVDRDGETRWIATDAVWIPHPVVLGAAVDDLRSLATELGLKQGVDQLFREVFSLPPGKKADDTDIDDYANGEFEMLSQAIGVCKKFGYKVSGGSAITRVWERGRVYEARYFIGDEDPFYETTTGSLGFVDDKKHELPLGDVPPITLSEGLRMASRVYAKRKIEKENDDA